LAAAGLAQRLINSILVLSAVKGSDHAVRLRDVQFAREPLYNDLAELCLAVLVSFGVASSPIALLFAFPFAALPLRTVRHAQLVTDARTDFKTGLLNAGTWQREAAAAVARAARAGQPVAVAVLDLDWFKQVNDTHGHLFGDEVLRHIGRCLPTALRDYDLDTGDFCGMGLGELLLREALRSIPRDRVFIQVKFGGPDRGQRTRSPGLGQRA
jgi:Diguanylate cyclase, GGDEF domain